MSNNIIALSKKDACEYHPCYINVKHIIYFYPYNASTNIGPSYVALAHGYGTLIVRESCKEINDIICNIETPEVPSETSIELIKTNN